MLIRFTQYALICKFDDQVITIWSIFIHKKRIQLKRFFRVDSAAGDFDPSKVILMTRISGSANFNYSPAASMDLDSLTESPQSEKIGESWEDISSSGWIISNARFID